MRVSVYKGQPDQISQIKQWLVLQFKDCSSIQSPTMAGIHRISYDCCLPGIIVIYFSKDSDYTLFSLRWH